jgi:hypothetical protein
VSDFAKDFSWATKILRRLRVGAPCMTFQVQLYKRSARDALGTTESPSLASSNREWNVFVHVFLPLTNPSQQCDQLFKIIYYFHSSTCDPTMWPVIQLHQQYNFSCAHHLTPQIISRCTSWILRIT